MATKKNPLGRGLDAIMLDSDIVSESGVIVVRISDVEPNAGQPRKDFNPEELASLADSIAEYGLIQPITVRKVGERYQIVAGERRWRAARMAGLSEIPVSVISADDKKSAEIALVENIQRKNLNPVEEAEAFSSLIDEYGLTQEDVGRRVGRSRSSITNTLRLLDLPVEVRKYLSVGTLSEGHARALLGLKDKEKIVPTADKVVLSAISVRETEKLVRELNAPPKEPSSRQDPEKEVYVKDLERKITSRLGRTVKIVQSGDRGTVNIGFSDNKDLDTVLRLICGDDFVDSL